MNLSRDFFSNADRLLLLPAVFMFVLVGVLSIVSLSVFWFDDELLLLPEFVIVGLVVKIAMRVMILIVMVRAKVMIMMINLLLLVMVEEMVVLRPPYVPF